MNGQGLIPDKCIVFYVFSGTMEVTLEPIYTDAAVDYFTDGTAARE